jgi:hydrogenase nickel incorporation protein HypA/HybF
MALMDQVTAIARQHGARRVERIELRVGPLSGIDVPALRQAYPLAAAGTVAEEATLAFEPAPVRVRCTRCGAETDAAANRLLCGECGDFRTQLVSGDEMLLLRLELVQDSDGRESGSDTTGPARPATTARG